MGGGRYAIVDGQTRAAAIVSLAAEDRAPIGVPCLVYHELTQADEAQLFARLQKERRGIASAHRFRAAVVAGEPEAIEIEAIANRVGYQVGPAGPGMLSAVAALEKVYRRGPEVLEQTLMVLGQAWPEPYVPAGDVIRGLGLVLAQDADIDRDRLADRLQSITPEALKRRALALSEGMGRGGGSEKYVADAIRGVYRTRVEERVAA